jgi:hypothetical protein
MALSLLKSKGSTAAIAALVAVVSAAVVLAGMNGGTVTQGSNEGEDIPLTVPASCECKKLAQTGFAVKDTLTAGVALALFIDRDYASLKEWDQMVEGAGCPRHAYFLYYKTAEKRTNVLGVTDEGDIYQSNLKCHEAVLR